VAQLSAARREAFRILLSVERGQSHSDTLLRGKAVSALSVADRNLATMLVLGVLRWQIVLDRAFRPLLKRPTAKLDAEILIALRLAAFQLLFLDRIPAHAAIGESVELAKQAGQQFASRMVNAVLRKLAAGASHFDLADRTVLDSISMEAYPAWMVERWTENYGAEAAHAICRHGQMQPALAMRIDRPDVEEELARAGVALVSGELLTRARTIVSGDVTATDAFRAGRVRIQDEGSQLIAELASASLDHNKGHGPKKILDACAAPGGKTLILAERNPGAQIVACESSTARLDQMRERMAAHAERIEFMLADAAALEEDSVFDLVLADVPCSGTGTLGRNPEIRHRLRAEDLARHAERQVAILRAAIRAVRPGGQVVYSTCSLEPEENEQVVDAILAEMPDARQLSFENQLDAIRAQGILKPDGVDRLRQCLTQAGALRLLPGSLGTDGFFIALLERFA
jgi:16S rRNA (cytosine967-C5)-methyltransferase